MDDEETEEYADDLVETDFIPEDYDERRRQWCVRMSLRYFVGAETVIQKAGEIEHYLIHGVTRLKALK